MSTWGLTGRLIRYRPWMFLIGFVTLVAWNSSGLLIGWLLQKVFDALSGGAAAGFSAYAIIAMVAAAEIAQGVSIWTGVIRDRYQHHLKGLLRLNLLHAQMRAQASTLAASPGRTLSSFRDDVNDYAGFVETTLLAAGKIVVAVGSMVIMLAVEPVIAVAVALPMLTVVVVTKLASTRLRANRAAYRRATASVTGLLGELFGGVLAGEVGPGRRRHPHASQAPQRAASPDWAAGSPHLAAAGQVQPGDRGHLHWRGAALGGAGHAPG